MAKNFGRDENETVVVVRDRGNTGVWILLIMVFLFFGSASVLGAIATTAEQIQATHRVLNPSTNPPVVVESQPVVVESQPVVVESQPKWNAGLNETAGVAISEECVAQQNSPTTVAGCPTSRGQIEKYLNPDEFIIQFDGYGATIGNSFEAQWYINAQGERYAIGK